MRTIVGIALALSLAACASTGGGPASRGEPVGAPYQLTASESKLIEDGVRDALKDPNSAMFGQMVAVRVPGDDMTTVCGYVNAKNSFGGYTGDKPFMGMLAYVDGKPFHFGVTGMGGTDTETMAVMMVCKDYGVIL